MLKNLNIISSSYLLLSGVISIVSLFSILLKIDLFNLWIAFSILFFIVTIYLTIIVNIKILKNLKCISRNYLLTNFVICTLQVFSISLSGFQFGFTQGLRVSVHTDIENLSNFMFGTYIYGFSLSLKIEFLEVSTTNLEINLLALFLAIFYFAQLKRMDSNSNI